MAPPPPSPPSAWWGRSLCALHCTALHCAQVLWGGTLVHVDDLPFKLVRMPQHYSDFRDALCGRAVRSPLPAPTQLKGLPVGA